MAGDTLMARGDFNEIKAKPWKGQRLKGQWQVTRKIDGARMLRDSNGDPVSRNGKPLYNLDHISKDITDAEIFEKDWNTSMGLVRSSVNGSPVKESQVYSLDPLDPRLDLGFISEPTVDVIDTLLQKQLKLGDEGLILRQGDKWLKVKPIETADVFITGFQKGTGKHEGRMGALITKYGKIGTGFSDAQREMFQKLYDEGKLIGELIEVEFMEWTSGGKFRHPRFLHIRTDKSEESV